MPTTAPGSGKQTSCSHSEFHERRSHQRLRLSRPVCLVISVCPREPSLKKTRLTGTTYDVSANGLAIISTQRIPEGSRLHLDLFMQGEQRVFHLNGIVERMMPFNQEGFYKIAVKLQPSLRRPLKSWRKYMFETLRFFQEPL